MTNRGYNLTFSKLNGWEQLCSWCPSGGTFALYSLICRCARMGLIPSQQAEDRGVSNFQLELPTEGLKRASKIKSKLENRQFAKLFLLTITMLGTPMVIGDGVLTPCISGLLIFNCSIHFRRNLLVLPIRNQFLRSSIFYIFLNTWLQFCQLWVASRKLQLQWQKVTYFNAMKLKINWSHFFFFFAFLETKSKLLTITSFGVNR